MKPEMWLGVLLAIIASTNLNVGKAIQKWKVKVLGNGRAVLAPEHRRDFFIWLLGFGLTASCTVIYSLALKYTDKPSMVSSLNGVGMIGLVIFAWLVLKEKIGFQEIGGALCVLLGTTVMGYFDQPPEKGQAFSLSRFLFSSIIMVVIFGPPAAYAWRAKRFHGLAFGAAAGVILGICLILGDMALVEAKDNFLGQLKNPYPYAAIILGIAALTITQFAFWRAPAMIVVPTINSFMILCPVVLDYFTFGTILKPLQYLGVGIIVVGVVLLTYTEAQDHIAEKKAPA